jgi:hypothetical protein
MLEAKVILFFLFAALAWFSGFLAGKDYERNRDEY